MVKQDEQVVAAFALNAAAGENNAGRRPHALPIWRLCRRYGWLNVWRMYLQMAVLRHTPAADELYLFTWRWPRISAAKGWASGCCNG